MGNSESDTINIIKNTKRRIKSLGKDYVEFENNFLKGKSENKKPIRNFKNEKKDIRLRENKLLKSSLKNIPIQMRKTSRRSKYIRRKIKNNFKSYQKDTKDN